MDIVIYTNSDFFDILPIQLDFLSKIINKNKYTVHILSDKDIPNCEYNIIIYDNNLPYASRILHCLDKIQSEHILITHENDVILKFNETIIDTCVNLMKKHGISSIELKQALNIFNPIKVTDSLFLSKKNTGYIYSVQPTIWNRNGFIFLLSNFKDKTYRTIECNEINNFILNRLNAYITYTTKPINTIWYKVTEAYYFIHLTSRLLLLPCSKHHNLDSYIQSQHEYIHENYLKNNKTRGFQQTIYSFASHMVTDHVWK